MNQWERCLDLPGFYRKKVPQKLWAKLLFTSLHLGFWYLSFDLRHQITDANSILRFMSKVVRDTRSSYAIKQTNKMLCAKHNMILLENINVHHSHSFCWQMQWWISHHRSLLYWSINKLTRALNYGPLKKWYLLVI